MFKINVIVQKILKIKINKRLFVITQKKFKNKNNKS